VTAARVGRRDARGAAAWWLSAVVFPVVALAAVLIIDDGWRLWSDLPRLARSQTATDALLLETVLMVIVAPLGGVALVMRRLRRCDRLMRKPSEEGTLRSAWSLAWPLCVGATSFSVTSAVLAWTVLGMSSDPLPLIATSHAALWAATLAVAAGGALCASVLSHPLDAAACAVGLALMVAAGVLVAGPVIGNAPTSVINAALQASPIVAVASAADVDILRMDVLYRLSPLAHVRFDYPHWQATCGWYVGLAITVLVAMTRTFGRRTDA